MNIRRRDFVRLAGAAALSGALPRLARSADTASVYDIERFGNARILHITDTHAQLKPVFFREPSVNLGIGAMAGKPPHLVGKRLSRSFRHPPRQRRRLCLHVPRIREGRRVGSASSAALRI